MSCPRPWFEDDDEPLDDELAADAAADERKYREAPIDGPGGDE
ncbi:MAG TPA: hypothetical protein VGH28_10420 [Polyangiaceae bacterium]|jgi:hypothetical protein